MPDLEIIRLSRNNIEQLDKRLFEINSKLRRIELDRNYIQYIVPSIFDGLMQLEIVHLEANKLTSLSPHLLTTVEGRNLRLFGIQHNPFDCGCDQGQYLKQWLLDNVELQGGGIFFAVCNSPSHQRGKLVYKHQTDVFKCVVKDILIYCGISVGVLLFTILIAIPCYKYRWYVKHIGVVWKALRGSFEIVKKEHICLYDAYMSFDLKCQEDSLWVVNELLPAIERAPQDVHPQRTRTSASTNPGMLRLYVGPRDAVPGEKRFTQREEALENSKRILIIVSNSYLNSVECLSEADLTGILMHGTEFFQPNRILVLVKEELNEEIIRPPISSLLQGKTLKVETEERRKEQMWKDIRKFLAKPLYMYCKPAKDTCQADDEITGNENGDSSETAFLLENQII